MTKDEQNGRGFFVPKSQLFFYFQLVFVRKKGRSRHFLVVRAIK